jgi:hypothetical protein
VTEGFSFQATGKRHGLEDRYLHDFVRGIIAVADGVTRVEYRPGDEEQSKRVGNVALVFCQTVLDQLADQDPREFAELLSRVGPRANARIRELNRTWGFSAPEDYVLRDPYAAVGSCGVLDQAGWWHFGYIGDSGVCCFGPDAAMRLLSQDQLLGTMRVLDSMSTASRQERFEYQRSRLRNRLDARDEEGRPCGYGVLNGDPSGEVFWRTGTVRVQPGDVLVAYTDGARHLLEQAEFQELARSFACGGAVAEAEAACREAWRGFCAARPEWCVDDATLAVARVRAT